jgi:hypothetical protein
LVTCHGKPDAGKLARPVWRAWERKRTDRKTVPRLSSTLLHKLTAQQSSDLYDVIIGRHRQSSLLMTSNRDIAEWVALFDDPILANSALDRLAHRSQQLVIEGESYRKRTSPHARRLAQ